MLEKLTPETDLADKLEALAPALDNLRNYQRQLDMDGCHVGVSRQALDEVLDAVERALRERDQAVEALRHAQGRFLNIKICLTSGGTKREAIRIADIGGDCIKSTLASIEGSGDE